MIQRIIIPDSSVPGISTRDSVVPGSRCAIPGIKASIVSCFVRGTPK